MTYTIPTPTLEDVVDRRIPCHVARDAVERDALAAVEGALAGIPTGKLVAIDRYDRHLRRRFEFQRAEAHWNVTVEPPLGSIEAGVLAAVRRGLLDANGKVELEYLGDVLRPNGSDAPLAPDARITHWHVLTVDGLRTFVGVLRTLYGRGDSQGLTSFFLATDRAEEILAMPVGHVKDWIARLVQRCDVQREALATADRHEVAERVRANTLQEALAPMQRLLHEAVHHYEQTTPNRAETRLPNHFVARAKRVLVEIETALAAQHSRLEGYSR